MNTKNILLFPKEMEELSTFGILWNNNHKKYDPISMVARKFSSSGRIICVMLLKHSPNYPNGVEPHSIAGCKINISFVGTKKEYDEYKDNKL